MKNIYALILAGGSGTRLWPISRDYYPKQFLTLLGNQTLIQQTFLRLKIIIPIENIFISTNRIFIDEILLQLEELGLQKENIIIQPADKNTGPAIIQASQVIYAKNKEATILTCPADHIIQPQTKFTATVKAGYSLAQNNFLVTFGIKPTEPNMGYGYIAIEEKQKEKLGAYTGYKVNKFIEKPSLEKAKTIIKQGSLWNSGIFMWKAQTILNEIKKLDEKIYKLTQDHNAYFQIEASPIDILVMEKSKNVWVIPLDFEWKDIGSWKALYDLLPKDANQNVLNKNVTAINCHNSLIFGLEGKTISAINVENMILVETQDTVFISHHDALGEIKSVIKPSKAQPLVTLIIPTKNDGKFLEKTFQSGFTQNYKNIEFITVDEGSKDTTGTIINKYQHRIEHTLTFPNLSRFERINKALSVANGAIIGILEPGNIYNDTDVIENIVKVMEQEKSDVCWGDLAYHANDKTDQVAMYWKSSPFEKGSFRKGWTPPFPTLFVRSSLYKNFGAYKEKFRIASDYEFMLRIFEKHGITGSYLPRILVKMIGKGLSLESILDRITGNIESYKSWKEHKLEISPLFLLSKNFGKVSQLLSKNK